MKLPIYLYGHPVLREVAEDITPDYPDLKQLEADMYETMYASEGVGLAAPQIGRSISMIVIDASPLAEDDPTCEDFKLTLVNPELEILDGDPVTRAEGCLSLPGLSENVPRVENIRLRWLDTDFKPHERVITGFASRVVQHEMDHLDGALYIDHIKPIRKQLIRGKLNNIVAGKTPTDYAVRIAPKHKK